MCKETILESLLIFTSLPSTLLLDGSQIEVNSVKLSLKVKV